MVAPQVDRITLRCRVARCPKTTEVTRSGAQRLKSIAWTDDPPTYLCHPHNTYEVAQPSRHGNKLKRQVLLHLSRTGLSKSAFARNVGWNPSSFKSWLDGDDRMTSRDNLERMAPELGIESIDEAIRLQGGTAEDRRLEHALVNIEALHKRVADDPALAQAAAERMAKAVRGTHFSEEHREGIRIALKAYRQRPEAHALHVLDGASIELRLMTVLRRRQEVDPDMMEWRELTVHERGKDPLRALAEQQSERFDVCVGTVVSSFNTQLAKQGASAIDGRPAEADRCDKLRAYLKAWLRLSPSGSTYRMWLSAPSDLKDARWSDDHERGCPALRRALVQVRRRESYGNPVAGGLT